MRCYEALGWYDDAIKETYKRGGEVISALKKLLDPGYRAKVDGRLVQRVARMAAYKLIKPKEGGGGRLKEDQMDLVNQALALFADQEVSTKMQTLEFARVI